MIDINKNKIRIGDKVAFNPPRYKGLLLGTVINFTPKKVKILYSGTVTTTVFPCDICICK